MYRQLNECGIKNLVTQSCSERDQGDGTASEDNLIHANSKLAPGGSLLSALPEELRNLRLLCA